MTGSRRIDPTIPGPRTPARRPLARLVAPMLFLLALPSPAGSPAPRTFAQPIPGAAYRIEMVHIPGDAAAGIRPFAMSATEITWNALDVFVYRLDEDDHPPIDTDMVTHPSKPYIPPDRGFGHEGFAAICISYDTAVEFCRWLSARSNRRYRLPTEAEWEHACRAGSVAEYSFGDDPARLGEFAFYKGNSGETTHPVASRKPNAFGLYDMHGNAAEWVAGRDGKPVLKGGSYLDEPERLKVSARAVQTPDWNATDPQIPKSRWWLSDAPFAGFRIVCEIDDPQQK